MPAQDRTEMTPLPAIAASLIYCLCTLLNMLDHMVGDGRLDPREREFLNEVQHALGLTDDFALYFKAIVIKNIRTAFGAHAPLRLAA